MTSERMRTEAAKVHDFRLSPKAGLCFSDDKNSVSLTGQVEIISDDTTRQRLWQEWLVGFFSGGPADPNYTLLRFVGQTATLWIDQEFTHKESI